MSIIHKFIEDDSTPEPVKWLFRRFVSEYNEQNSITWNQYVKQKTDEYHRKTLLKQGRCDFDKPPHDLTSAELIVLYNYYYFPMHFQSSFEIFNRLFEEHEDFKNKSFFFHDYGCGTISSSMAFGASFQKYNICEAKHYQEFKYNNIDVFRHLHFYTDEASLGEVSSCELGIIRNAGSVQYFNLPNFINGFCLNDISTSIISFLQGFLKENFYSESFQNYFFNTASCTDTHFHFDNVADKFYLGNFSNDPIQPFKSFCNSQHKSTNDLVVVLNFSYALASESINIEHIKELIEEYQKTGCNLIIINQNPNLDFLNSKWEELKKSINCKPLFKGIQPIKHFGSKSKSRFEIISLIEEDFGIFIENLKSDDGYNADIIQSFIITNDLFFQNRISNILKNKEFSLALKIPRLIEDVLSSSYEINSDFLHFLGIYQNQIWDPIDEIKIKILSNIDFIDWLLGEISRDIVNQKDLIHFFDSNYIIKIPVYIRINIWDKILQNERLAHEFITNHYFEGGLFKNDDQFNNLFIELALKWNYQFIITDYDYFHYYQQINNIISARYYIENIIQRDDYGSFRQEVMPEYLNFMSLNFPEENISKDDDQTNNIEDLFY